ncbi:hypothetical protein HYX14_01735 [Candidatus Woesearchaeota archaeon]|nr:hypothetical protein [Candidatus Woesearchaeota archaeon]
MKRAQIEVTFNWIYILIAGAVILLFFAGIVVKQKSAAEEKLGVDVVRTMESIFTAAGVSESTKNVIDISGLADYTLFFDCADGVSEFGIKGTSARAENVIDPVFAPKEIRSTKLIAWSLPYKLPYKASDLLMVTSTNTYYIITGPNTGFVDEFIKNTVNTIKEFNVKYESDMSNIDPGKNFQIRIIDTGGTIKMGAAVPASLKEMDDARVTAVSFVGSNLIQYFKKAGPGWGSPQEAQIISLGGEQDAAKYAAIFAGDKEAYECNMQKAWRRAEQVNKVYQAKLDEIEEYYQQNPQTLKECVNYLSEYNGNVEDSFGSHVAAVPICLAAPGDCPLLITTAFNLQQANKNMLLQGDCLTLY